ncbi:MAG TPA: UbiA family prenyltransferase [Rhodanobacteraceae bacterium]|nr:UbiA family prenyltransferase [Rhodanobacteraceae bacterium]
MDLDGTLIRSDLLAESALGLLRRNPLYLLRFGVWLLRGKAHLKREIAQRTSIDVTTLPYEPRVLDWLRSETAGRHRVLCTASDSKFAEAVAAHVGGFDEVLASDGERNLSGRNKADTLGERFGERGFDYAGNEARDLHVWSRARRAIVVNAPRALARRAGRVSEVERVFERSSQSWRDWLRALRLHQWLKNLLVFLPLLTAHLVLAPDALLHSTLAFFSFCLCASGVYLLNDLLDLEADRRHPRKRLRPFAAGNLSLTAGLVAAPLLTLAAFALALTAISKLFALALAAYYALTLAYSFALKRIAMLDTVVLAGLYTIRIIAGTLALRIGVSFWLLAFSMFLFLSLAMIKRYTELRTLLRNGDARTSGRGYAVDDLPLVQSLGGSSGYLAVLVLALYINSTASELLYRRPAVLWLLCPLLLYWISRAWLIAHRGDMHDDPVVFAVSDRTSRLVLALAIIIVIGAI